MSKDAATFSRDSARRISEVVREAERSRTVGRDRPGRPPRPTYDKSTQQRFVAKLVGEGPEEEEDFDDARYWVREVNPKTLEVLINGRWVEARNLCELEAPNHLLRNTALGEEPPDRYVVVTDIGGYIFDSYPAQMIPLWGYKVDCLDEDGCPQGAWYQMHGPGFVVAATPEACEPEPGA